MQLSISKTKESATTTWDCMHKNIHVPGPDMPRVIKTMNKEGRVEKSKLLRVDCLLLLCVELCCLNLLSTLKFSSPEFENLYHEWLFEVL